MTHRQQRPYFLLQALAKPLFFGLPWRRKTFSRSWRRVFLSGIPTPMKADLVDQAAQVINDPPILINMVSKRVKQLSMGRPALVDRRPGMREADVALTEILQGKIKREDLEEESAE